VLAERGFDPYQARKSVAELGEWVKRPDWATILSAYGRCVRITRDKTEQYNVRPSDFVVDEERNLWAAYQAVPTDLETVSSVGGFFTAFTPLIPPITAFFEKVLVMDENPRVRENRLGLLQKIAGLAKGVVDLSKLEGF
jgi:glycyl-tRNA synthetase